MNYKRIPTTYEVYRTILNNHVQTLVEAGKSDLSVLESYTNIVDHGTSTIYTVWGLKGADCPLIGAETTYDRDWGVEVEGTEKHEYWLCVPICECEE